MALNKYKKIMKPKESVVKDEEEIRVTAAGSVSAYVSRAAKLFNELEKNYVVIAATGNALTKAVTSAEVIKRRFKGLHQVTKLGNQEIIDEYEPLEEGLDKVTETRNMPFVEIKLSKEPLDVSDKGYQAPIDESEVKEVGLEEMMSRGRGRGSGKGRGKGRGKEGKGQDEDDENKGKSKGKGKGKGKGEGGEGKGKKGDSKGKGKGKGKTWEDDWPVKGKGKGKGDTKGKSKGSWEDAYPVGKGSKSKGKGRSSWEDEWHRDDYWYGYNDSKGKSKGKGKDKGKQKWGGWY